jgi:hypothetical protein
MTTFDEREQGFEAAFAHEQEVEFKAHMRRDRRIGLWAGERMGLTGEALESYAQSLCRAELREHDQERLFQKILADLADAKVEVLPHEVRARMDQLLAEAREEIKSGG